jgi:hypothetical protein
VIELVRIVKHFIRESNIQLDAKKCEILKLGEDHHQSFSLQDDSRGEITYLDCPGNKHVIRYLGVPLGKGNISRMKWYERLLTKMKTKETILAESGLKTTQVIDFIKTFVLPYLNFF